MRYWALALLIGSVSFPAFASPGKKIDLKPKHDKVEDPGSAESLLYKTSPPSHSSATDKGIAVKVETACTDSMGMIHKSGDKGYEACLRTLDRLKARPTNEKNPNSIGISFGK